MSKPVYDILVIGGGINGTAIANDASGRGLKVILCEQDDLASATSSSSTKLIHGGLRYLEQFEFHLVREALYEREVMLNKAPHITTPLEFVMPYKKSIRPYWLIRLGLFIYDHLAGRKKLSGSRGIDLEKHSSGTVLKEEYRKGFVYSDCWTDDARLVVLNALAAKENGATILTRTKIISAVRENELWQVTTQDVLSGKEQTKTARAIINAAGPWVDDILINKLKLTDKKNIALVKGSHIIVPRINPSKEAYILQGDDKRVIFVIPYLQKFSLIGTTDVKHDGDPKRLSITPNEINYLCDAVNVYFKKKIGPEDIIGHYSGVRPLKYDDSATASEISRDYEFALEDKDNKTPILSIFGGKLTTHRRLAEQAVEKLKAYFPNMGSNWTEEATLPGGDIPDANFEVFFKNVIKRYPNLPKNLLFQYAQNYGSRCFEILKNATSTQELGEHFGADLFEEEIKYSINKEFSRTADDILWRRTKHGMFLNAKEIEKVSKQIKQLLENK
jgi:glycerol-3-phosphate dehydrogenase